MYTYRYRVILRAMRGREHAYYLLLIAMLVTVNYAIWTTVLAQR
jgi:hypothetical protein